MEQISPDIIYIGANDDNLDLFEGQYPVPSGISYNSFLIADDITTIVDAVDIRRCDDWLSSLQHALESVGKTAPARIIVQHVEPDHTGSLGKLIALYPDIQIVCTAKAQNLLSNFFSQIDFTKRCIIVTDGDTMQLGKTTLKFVTAPMVHWPEVMMTLDTTHNVLFSADAFGSFAMVDSTEAWDDEARRYYANIVGRFGASVAAVMSKLKGLEFSAIAPLHGPLLTSNLEHYWNLYTKWSKWQPEKKGLLVAYASVYGNTAKAARMAASIAQRFNGYEVSLIDLCRHHSSYAVAQAFRLSDMLLCSITLDSALFPKMQSFLHHLESKKLTNRNAAIIENGSWAPAAARIITEHLNHMKNINIVSPALTLHGALNHNDVAVIEQMVSTLHDSEINSMPHHT